MNTEATLEKSAKADFRLTPAKFTENKAFWLDSKPQLSNITLTLPDACIDELDATASRLSSDITPLPDKQAAAAMLMMPHCAQLAAEVRERLEDSPGAVLVDRFPAERYSDSVNRMLCGLFSSMVAPLMSQNFEGTKLYEVMDKKTPPGMAVRRSITNLRQDYHTDGGWVESPARLIGLYCIRNAKTGGYSLVTSLLAAYDELRKSHPHVIECLSRQHPWDRQGEHGKDDIPYEMHPIFVQKNGGFLARFYESYVRNGYVKMDRTISREADEALTLLATRLDAQQRIRFLLEAGQFQYVNNYTVVHAREAFEDHGEVAGGRHLIRVWHH